MRSAVGVLAWLPMLAACGEAPAPGGASGASGALETPAPSRLRFVDGTRASGLDAFRQRNGSPDKMLVDESFGAGVALVDVDGDGDLDAYLTNGGTGQESNGAAPADALFLNDGAGHFTDGTEAAGLGDRLWSYGVTAADYDGDGDADLYVTNHGPNRLYRNDGGTFVDVASELGVADARWSTGARFFDFDRDGDLDLYVANHIAFDRASVAAQGLREDYFDLEVYYGPLGLDPAPDALYRQESDGTFTDVSLESGIAARPLFAFQVVTFDWDRDGWPDLYVANDSTPNVLWHNRRDGTFEDVALGCGVALSSAGSPQAGMGVAVGDFDGDGREDLYVTNFSEDYFTLYRGGERGIFRDVTTRANLYRPTLHALGWAAFLEDFDADGDLDLFAANGHVFPQVDRLGRRTRYRQRNQLFENLSGGRFRLPPDGGGPGLAVEAASRGAAVGDVDGDGDRDVLVGNLDGPPTLLLNESRGGETLVVRLVGAAGNLDAVGARVVARVGERRLLRLVGVGSGFLSASDPRLHLGLGSAKGVDELVVTWPDGSVTEVADVAAGRVVTVAHGRGVVGEEPLGR